MRFDPLGYLFPFTTPLLRVLSLGRCSLGHLTNRLLLLGEGVNAGVISGYREYLLRDLFLIIGLSCKNLNRHEIPTTGRLKIAKAGGPNISFTPYFLLKHPH